MCNWRDWQSVFYLLLLPAVVIWQWRNGFHWSLYLLELFLTLGVGVIHHNHAHLRMWRSRALNRVTDLWIGLLQGHPTFVFYPAHMANHHRHKHGERDVARTYRFSFPGARGDTNHLMGYLLHPIQAISVLYPLFFQWMRRMYVHHRAYFNYAVLQYLMVLGCWLVLAALDWKNWLLFVLIPQLHGLHWLLATNYLQHAHADGSGKGLNFARNFYGWVNPLLFNIGLHTAHHQHPRAHWSELSALQEQYYPLINPCLNERGLLRYMWRTYCLGLLHPRWRSRSLNTKE
ncbi:MAG TPA: fatty acid desaturase [Cellvibrio sp.]|nr:fatty acid desaturase [Cellvibrio sp.]